MMSHLYSTHEYIIAHKLHSTFCGSLRSYLELFDLVAHEPHLAEQREVRLPLLVLPHLQPRPTAVLGNQVQRVGGHTVRGQLQELGSVKEGPSKLIPICTITNFHFVFPGSAQ